MQDRKKFLRNRGALHRETQKVNPATPSQPGSNPFALNNTPNSTPFNTTNKVTSNPFNNLGNPQNANSTLGNNSALKTPNKQLHPLPVNNNPNLMKFNQLGKTGNIHQFNLTSEDLSVMNSSDEHLRFTSAMFPCWAKGGAVQMPIGCHARPWFNTGEEVPVVDLFDLFRQKTGQEPGKKFDIPRCEKCRGYINSFFKFSAKGKQMTCNLCLFTQNVPAFYMAEINEFGQRVDLEER